MSQELDELRDALDDAIRQAFCEPPIPPLSCEDAAIVRNTARAAILTNPDRMRHLAVIQAAAWAVVQERVEDEADDAPRHAHYARAVSDAYSALTNDDLTPNASVEAVEAAREALADMIVDL